MSVLCILTLILLCLAVQAAGRNGCCTTFSKVRAVKSIMRRGAMVQCRLQDITEGCSINAVVLKWKRHKVCVDPTPRKIRKVLAVLCSHRKARKGDRHPRRQQRRKI